MFGKTSFQNSGVSFDFPVLTKIAYEIRGSRKSQVEKIFRVQEWVSSIEFAVKSQEITPTVQSRKLMFDKTSFLTEFRLSTFDLCFGVRGFLMCNLCEFNCTPYSCILIWAQARLTIIFEAAKCSSLSWVGNFTCRNNSAIDSRSTVEICVRKPNNKLTCTTEYM